MSNEKDKIKTEINVQLRMSLSEHTKIKEDAKALGFITTKGEANVTAYIKFLAHNVKVNVILNK